MKGPARSTPPLWQGRGRWLTVAAVAGFAGGVGLLHDALRLLRREGFAATGDAIFGWVLAAMGVAAIVAANFVLSRARWAWSVLMALAALAALLGLLTVVGRQASGLLFLGAGACVMLSLWWGRAALGRTSS